MQVQTNQRVYSTFVDCFVRTYKGEGLRGLYSGFGIAFLGSAPAACMYFTSYEKIKDALSTTSLFKQSPFAAAFVSGLSAEALSCIFWVPIDVIKERLQVQGALPALAAARASASSSSPSAAAAVAPAQLESLKYRGNVHALRTVLATEGLRGIYKGYGATLFSFGPFSAIFLSTYEKFKAACLNAYGLPADSVHVPLACVLTSGVASGTVASVLTNPLDMAKLRMQVQRGNAAFSFNYNNVFHGVKQIVLHEGVRGLFKGVTARIAFHAPSTSISIASYEKCKELVEYFRQKQKRQLA